jgi:hypothetical protein
MKNYYKILLIIFYLFIAEVFAIRPNVHKGGITIDPIFSIKHIYDTNIYLAPASERGADNITDLKLGLNINLPLVPEREKDIIASVMYRLDYLAYWKNTGRSRMDHNLNSYFNSKLFELFNFSVRQHFKRTADPPNTERTALEKRNRNAIGSALTYLGHKMSVEGNYQFVRDAFDNFKNLSKSYHILTGSFFWKYLPKTFMFLEYDYCFIDYDNNTTNSNSNSNQIRLGISGDLWLRSFGVAKIGYRNVHYNEKEKKNYQGLALHVDIRWDITQRTRTHVFVTFTSEESTYSINSYFASNLIGLLVSHQLTERLGLNCRGDYIYNKYPAITQEDGKNAKRKDVIWRLKAGLKYEIREWVFSEIQYEFAKRNSVFNNFDYLDNKIWGSIAFTF